MCCILALLRLLYRKDKREQPETDKIDDFEAQLVAEALAASQANLITVRAQSQPVTEAGPKQLPQNLIALGCVCLVASVYVSSQRSVARYLKLMSPPVPAASSARRVIELGSSIWCASWGRFSPFTASILQSPFWKCLRITPNSTKSRSPRSLLSTSVSTRSLPRTNGLASPKLTAPSPSSIFRIPLIAASSFTCWI
jgi:hypothetical protein